MDSMLQDRPDVPNTASPARAERKLAIPAKLAIIAAAISAIGWLAWVMVFSERASLDAARAEEVRRQEQLRQQFPSSESAGPVHMPGHAPP